MNFGKFTGDIEASFMPDGVNMMLLSSFSYTDPSNKTWTTPKDYVTDGASIPREFWTIVGAPFNGKYRNAAVIHDFACDNRSETWQSVHQMFYNACRCGGTSEIESKILYFAVYHLGPRWVFQTKASIVGAPHITAGRVTSIAKYVKENNPSLEEIQCINTYKFY